MSSYFYLSAIRLLLGDLAYFRFPIEDLPHEIGEALMIPARQAVEEFPLFGTHTEVQQQISLGLYRLAFVRHNDRDLKLDFFMCQVLISAFCRL